MNIFFTQNIPHLSFVIKEASQVFGNTAQKINQKKDTDFT